MKKEEIEDRLMDALLRGECEEDLGSNVKHEASQNIVRANFVRAVLGIAAVLAMAAAGISVWKKNQSPEGDASMLTTAHAESVKDAERELARLDAEIEKQKARVEAKRKVLNTLVRISGRPYFEGSLTSSETRKENLTRMAESNAFEMRKNQEQYGVYLDRLQNLDSEQRLRYAAELPVENNSVRSLHQEYLRSRSELEATRANGLGANDPNVKVQEKRLEGLRKDLERGVETLQDSIALNREMLTEQLVVMEATSEEREAELVALATDMHDFKEAAREYEQELAQLQELKIKHSSTRQGLGGSVEANRELQTDSSMSLVLSQKPTLAAPPLVAEMSVPPVEFGSSSDFGAGWGGSGSGGTFFGRAPDQEAAKMRELRKKLAPLKMENQAILEANSEQYGQLVDQPWKDPRREALSTFSVDVDTASYTNLRRLLGSGADIPADAVRIEELVNYFDYDYPQPAGGAAFGVGLEMATCPWQPQHNLVRVALQGKEVKQEERGDANLVFLVDVSGSMRDSDKLPLLVESLGLMVEELRENDSVAIVVYAGNEGLALKPTRMGQGGRETVLQALGRLAAGGSTNGGAGIKLAYRLAQENFVEGGINRVILATDGDFNVGMTGQDNLVQLVKKKAAEGVFLSVCGFGRGNLNDSLLEAITNEGNGVYYYIDSLAEGRRVFLEKLMGTLVTIAKDVKIQVEFNPAKVAHYRLIGYANRILAKEDFNDDQVDAGDIGSGHQVTAFYEVVPVGVKGTVRPKVDDLKYQPQPEEEQENGSQDWLTAKLRHKKPEGEVSALQEFVLKGDPKPWAHLDADFRFAAGVAMWGMGLRGVDDLSSKKELMLEMLVEAAGEDEKRTELLELLRRDEGE